MSEARTMVAEMPVWRGGRTAMLGTAIAGAAGLLLGILLRR